LNLVVPEIYFQRKNWAFCWGSQLRLLITYFFLVLPLGGISLCVEDRQRHWDCSSCIRKGGNIEAIIPVLERVATGDPLKRIFEMPSQSGRSPGLAYDFDHSLTGPQSGMAFPATRRVGCSIKRGRTWGAKMLQQFGEEIWTVDGPTVSVAGFSYPTRMIVIRLSDGALFVWSPTAISDELRAAIDSLGQVQHIVAPNTLHHMFVGEWQAAYPAAKSYAVLGLRAKRPDLKWDLILDDTPTPEWSNEIDQVVVGGNRITTEVVFFHRASRTAIFTDLIQHFEPGWFKGWRAIVAKLDFLTAIRPTVPRKFRMTFRNREGARRAVQRIMAWPTAAVLTAHGALIRNDGQAAIAHAFDWLLGGKTSR